MNFKDLVEMLAGSYAVIAAITATVVALAVAIAFLMTPVYRAEVVMLPAANESGSQYMGNALGSIGGLASIAGLNLGSGDRTDEALAILNSRTFIESFIRELDLLPRLFPDKWDADAGEWSVSPRRVPTLYDGYRTMIEDVMSTRLSASSPIIRFRVDWTDPKTAADWANTLITTLNEDLRNRAIRESERSIEFLNSELEKSQVLEIQQGIYSLIEGRIQEIMLANISDEYAFRVIDRAAPPDLDDWTRPNRLLIILFSVPLGLIVAVMFLLVRHALRDS